MRLEGRRESTNVEDRRGVSGGAIAGGLGGGAIIIALIVMLLGGDPTSVLQQAGTMQQTEQTGEVTFSAEEQELASFAKKILAGTEDIWTAQFAKYGYQYQPPKMVLYTGTTSSGCGTANSQVGPFYCSADQTVYLDLSFLSTMKRQIGADGDLAYAYVIAHEVGHHIEYLLGTLNKAHQKMSRSNKVVANQESVSPTTMPESGPITTTRVSVPLSPATSRKPSIAPRRSVTTISRRSLKDMLSPSPSPTARPSSVTTGSRRA